MTQLKTVFAIVPNADAAESAVAVFQALPHGMAAKLVGLHVAPLAVRYGLVTDIVLSSYIEAQMAAADALRKSAEDAFAGACRKDGVSFEWRTEKAMDHAILAHAGGMSRAADVIIFPQQRDEGRQPEEVVFASGRPVICVPASWSIKTLGKRALIAWDGSREAARAVFDAIPILKVAEGVRIVAVQGVPSEPIRKSTPGDEISAALSSHDVKVDSRAVAGNGRTVREVLTDEGREFGADLLVMGCYGHSRVRERVLGGVSRDVLSDIPLPLLLSN